MYVVEVVRRTRDPFAEPGIIKEPWPHVTGCALSVSQPLGNHITVVGKGDMVGLAFNSFSGVCVCVCVCVFDSTGQFLGCTRNSNSTDFKNKGRNPEPFCENSQGKLFFPSLPFLSFLCLENVFPQ